MKKHGTGPLDSVARCSRKRLGLERQISRRMRDSFPESDGVETIHLLHADRDAIDLMKVYTSIWTMCKNRNSPALDTMIGRRLALSIRVVMQPCNSRHASSIFGLDGGRYLSTHRGGSGIGLASIKSAAERYGGTATFRHEGMEFVSGVVIPMGRE